MKIKRFQAADVRQGIREVSEALGPDAVILSNTRVDGGVEIVAATDYDDSQFRRQAAPARQHQETPSVEIEPAPQQAQVNAPRHDNIWSQEPTLVQMRKEIAGLRDMLQNQLSDLTWKDMARQSPTQIQLLKQHLHMGTDVELAKQLVRQAAGVDDLETAWRQSLDRLAAQIPLQQQDMIEHGGITALVGPTGVGKTTTIAKIAAHCALKHGAKNVALISTDCYRIAGQEQLRTYARILGVPVRVAHNHQEIATALSDLLERRYILIDTASMNPRDMRLAEKFAMLQQQSARIGTVLTLSATTQNSALDDMLSAFSHLNLDGCILTKTDEAGSLGGAISSMIRHQLPLAYVCNGQQVPEDLSLAQPNSLVNQASELMHSAQHNPAPHTVSSYGGFAAYG